MPQPYELAQTFAPRAMFADLIAAIAATPLEFCRMSGLSYATFMRVTRMRSASKKTALRIARTYAIMHDHLSVREALDLLFEPRPRVVMEPVPGTTRFRRRADVADNAE